MTNQKMLTALPAVVVLAANAHAITIHVDDDNCPGPGSGTETDPFCSIQHAIDTAAGNDEIVVAPGTYHENIDFLGKTITLRGLDGPDVTTIDAQGMGRVVTCNSGEGADTTLEGFTITGGFTFEGAGIRISDSSLTVTDCTFIGNHAEQSGGGMHIENSSSTVANCRFIGEATERPGVEPGWGGAIYAIYSSLTLVECDFSDNSAIYLGGAVNAFECSLGLTECSFSRNAARNGGACMLHGYDGDAILVRCTFSDNHAGPYAVGWGFGGAIYLNNGIADLVHCAFVDNEAAGGGGAAFHGDYSDLRVSNCAFNGNSAGTRGGGMHSEHAVSATVKDCTFSGNSANAGGGGMYSSGSANSTLMSNCILWENSPDEILGTTAVFYSDVQGGWPGTGNIDTDPLFVAPDTGDFRLSARSPCIDAGDNTAVPEGILTDLDGAPRFVDDPGTADTGFGNPPIVDMGASEFQNPCPWDCSDGDGEVGAVDFLAVLAQWGQVGVPCDFDGGGVGVTDFLELIANWGVCPSSNSLGTPSTCAAPPSGPLPAPPAIGEHVGGCSIGSAHASAALEAV